MADKVSDKFLEKQVEYLSAPGFTEPSRLLAEALRELIVRRKDGSPEEFIVATAAQVGSLPESHQGLVLKRLSEMREALTSIRSALQWVKEPARAEHE